MLNELPLLSSGGVPRVVTGGAGETDRMFVDPDQLAREGLRATWDKPPTSRDRLNLAVGTNELGPEHDPETNFSLPDFGDVADAPTPSLTPRLQRLATKIVPELGRDRRVVEPLRDDQLSEFDDVEMTSGPDWLDKVVAFVEKIPPVNRALAWAEIAYHNRWLPGLERKVEKLQAEVDHLNQRLVEVREEFRKIQALIQRLFDHNLPGEGRLRQKLPRLEAEIDRLEDRLSSKRNELSEASDKLDYFEYGRAQGFNRLIAEYDRQLEPLKKHKLDLIRERQRLVEETRKARRDFELREQGMVVLARQAEALKIHLRDSGLLSEAEVDSFPALLDIERRIDSGRAAIRLESERLAKELAAVDEQHAKALVSIKALEDEREALVVARNGPGPVEQESQLDPVDADTDVHADGLPRVAVPIQTPPPQTRLASARVEYYDNGSDDAEFRDALELRPIPTAETSRDVETVEINLGEGLDVWNQFAQEKNIIKVHAKHFYTVTRLKGGDQQLPIVQFKEALIAYYTQHFNDLVKRRRDPKPVKEQLARYIVLIHKFKFPS